MTEAGRPVYHNPGKYTNLVTFRLMTSSGHLRSFGGHLESFCMKITHKKYSETNAYLSFSYNAAEQEESDGKWKFSSKNQVGPSIGGNVFIDSRAQTPDQIETDSKCFWFKHYGPKKNRKFRTVNCIYSPELFSFEGDGAVGVTFSKGPKSKLSFLSGVYAPTTLDTYDNAYAKVRDFNLKFSAGKIFG